MRIAVVGSGIAGLVAAHHLSRRHEVTVFEAENRLGGHTHTVRVESAGVPWDVDTGFIVFNRPNYPEFCRLIDGLGIVSQPTTMSFAVRNDRTGIEYNGSSLGQLFAQRRNLFRPRFWSLLRQMLRFYRRAAKELGPAGRGGTVADFVRREAYSPDFVEHHLGPLGASLWSCPPAKLQEFPIRSVLEFLNNHAMLTLGKRPEWRTLRGGSGRYLEPMARPFRERVRLSCPVRRIRRREDGVEIVTDSGGAEVFDEAVLAGHSDQSLALLADPSAEEREILGAIPFQENEVVLHTDTRVLPRPRRAWAAWNYLVLADDPGRAVVTYNMNLLQRIEAAETFCVTLNRTEAIDPGKIIRRLRYAHPLSSLAADDARRRHPELIRRRRTSYCGAWWGHGFHEDGVRSALAVVRAFGEEGR